MVVRVFAAVCLERLFEMASNSVEPSSALFTRVFVYALMGFATFGFVSGMLQVVVTDLLTAFDLTSGALGRAFTIGSIGSLPIMFYGGRIADRFGLKSLLVLGCLVLAAALFGTSLARSYSVLVLLLLLSACASGALDVGFNAASITAEQRSGRKLIAYCHAAFSAFAALSALLAGLVLSVGISFRWLYVLSALVCVLYAVIIVLGGEFPREVPKEIASKGIGRPRNLFREPVLLLLGGVVALGSISESSLETWSAVYLREAMGLPALVGASGIAGYHLAMFLSRVLIARLALRFSRRTLLVASGLTAFVGMTLALSTTYSVLVLGGFFVVGLALAGVAPMGFSLAGDLSKGRAGETSSVMTLISYSGFLIAPGLIGMLATALGLRAALGTVILSGLLVAWFSRRVKAP